MPERAEPSANETIDNYKLALAVSRSFGAGWIVPTTDDIYASTDGASTAPLNAFDESHSSSSNTVNIDTGEAFVGGKYCWQDYTTDVTLPLDSTETVYVALPRNSGNDVRIDYDGGSAYPPEPNSRLPLWEFTLDSSGVTSVTDKRVIGNPITVDSDGKIQVNGTLDMNGESIDNLTETGNSAIDSPQGSTVYVQDSAPSSPEDDDIWIDTS